MSCDFFTGHFEQNGVTRFLKYSSSKKKKKSNFEICFLLSIDRVTFIPPVVLLSYFSKIFDFPDSFFEVFKLAYHNIQLLLTKIYRKQ